MSGELLLIGSVPLDTAEELFRIFGAPLGPYLCSLPDGEVGPRRHWISRVHYRVFVGHPDLEIVRRQRRDNGIERLNPHDASDNWGFKVKDGVDQVRFGDPGWRLGYARDALNSYAIFKALKERGALPASLRLQVSMPIVNSVLPPRIFPGGIGDLDKDQAKLRGRAEGGTRHHRSQDSDERVGNSVGLLVRGPGFVWRDPAISGRRCDRAKSRTNSCAGPRNSSRWGARLPFLLWHTRGWPRFAPDDLGKTVDLANAFVGASGRSVDWIHLPILDRTDDAFFAPLARLEPRDARVYLGLIHHMDSFRQRLAVARKYLPDFGIAAYCGFGRLPPSELPDLLAEHLEAVKIAANI